MFPQEKKLDLVFSPYFVFRHASTCSKKMAMGSTGFHRWDNFSMVTFESSSFLLRFIELSRHLNSSKPKSLHRSLKGFWFEQKEASNMDLTGTSYPVSPRGLPP